MKKKLFLVAIILYLVIGLSFYAVPRLLFPSIGATICQAPIDNPTLRECETYPQLGSEIVTALIWTFFWLPGIFVGDLMDFLRSIT